MMGDIIILSKLPDWSLVAAVVDMGDYWHCLASDAQMAELERLGHVYFHPSEVPQVHERSPGVPRHLFGGIMRDKLQFDLQEG